MTKGSVLQKVITTLSVYWPSKRAPNYMWQKLPEQPEEIDEYFIMIVDFNTLSQKWTNLADRKTLRIQLNSKISSQPHLIDIYRLLHPTSVEYTHSAQAPSGTFTKINHIMDYKTCLNKFKRTEIRPLNLEIITGI